MPVSKELRKLLEENKLNKNRPTGTKWTSGKRWDRIQTVKKNLEKLHGENEVQYAVFMTYPNPKGDPSHYLYMEGEEIQKLLQNQLTFSKAFLELEPKWTNPSTFVPNERINKRNRLCSHTVAESDQSEENDLPATPREETSTPPAADKDATLAAGSQINHSIVEDTPNQNEHALFQNQDEGVLHEQTEAERTEMSKDKHFLKSLKQESYIEKQKKYRQRKYKPKKRLLPMAKRKKSEDQSDIDQETRSNETKIQKSQEDPNEEGTMIHENSTEETQTVIICINLGEDGTLHLEETDCQGIT